MAAVVRSILNKKGYLDEQDLHTLNRTIPQLNDDELELLTNNAPPNRLEELSNLLDWGSYMSCVFSDENFPLLHLCAPAGSAFAKCMLGNYYMINDQHEKAGLWYIRSARQAIDEETNDAFELLCQYGCENVVDRVNQPDEELAKVFVECYRQYKEDHPPPSEQEMAAMIADYRESRK